MTKRIQRLKRELGVKATNDPDGVMASLQIARRLINDGDTAVYSVMDDATRLAAPKDHAIAWWAAHHALISALPTGVKTLGQFSVQSSSEELVALFDTAIKNQGTMNAAIRKGKWAK